MSEKIEYIQMTSFIMPIWYDEFGAFKNAISEQKVWKKHNYEPEQFSYFLPNITNIFTCSDLLETYEYTPEVNDLYLYQDLYQDKIKLKEIKLYCFDTGVGFFEYVVEYEKIDFQDISSFAYEFKKSNRADTEEKSQKYIEEHGLKSAAEFADELIGDNATCFFYTQANTKKEFMTFTIIGSDKQLKEEEAKELSFHLFHSYNSRFAYENNDFKSYEMFYEAFKDDYWGGCIEGMTNTFFAETENQFLYDLKNTQYSQYRLMFLLLLNQRFAAIKYIEQVAISAVMNDKKGIEKVNKSIIRLQSVYSFRVISNDKVYQSVYSKMYKIFEIDMLIEDMNDNHEQFNLLEKEKREKATQNRNKLLTVISILAIASFLIDLTAYLEYWEISSSVVPYIPLGIILLILLVFVLIYFKKDED